MLHPDPDTAADVVDGICVSHLASSNKQSCQYSDSIGLVRALSLAYLLMLTRLKLKTTG